MTRTFNNPLGKQLVTVDDEGIHEHRRDRLSASIRWDELDSLSRMGARSNRGTRIYLRLAYKCSREFEECASEAWKERYPGRWQRHWERSRRAANWAAYFWFPLLTLGPCVAGYALAFWALGWAESLQHEIRNEILPRFHRITAVNVVFLVGFLTWYRHLMRKRLSRLHKAEVAPPQE